MNNQDKTGHVYFYAAALDNNDQFKYDYSSFTNIIKFDYYPTKRKSLFNQSVKFELTQSEIEESISNEDQNSVILYSQQSFKLFCEKLLESEFGTRNNFHIIKSNCTKSVKFALHSANLRIAFNDKLSFKHLNYFFVCPTYLTTPREFITTLKEYKRNNKEEHSYHLKTNSNFVEIINQNSLENREIESLESKAICYEKINTTCTAGGTCLLFAGAATVPYRTLSNDTNPSCFTLFRGAIGKILGLFPANYFLLQSKNLSEEIKDKRKNFEPFRYEMK